MRQTRRLFLVVLLSVWASMAVAQRADLPQQDMGIIIATHYGAGDCSATTLNAAISAIGNTVTTLLIPPVPRNSVTPCTWNLATAVTVPATLTLQIPAGVRLTPALGITLTITGPILAGEYPIFNAANGTVKFGPNSIHTYPAAWFGLRCDETTTNTTELQKAINAVPITGSSVRGSRIALPAGTCKMSSPVTISTTPVYLIGTGGGRSNQGSNANTRLLYTGSGTFITVTTSTASGTVLEGFDINHQPTGSTASVGIDIENAATGVTLRDVTSLSPTTAWSIAAIRIGNGGNVHSTSLNQVFLRRSAPVGLLLVEVQSTILLWDSTSHHHSVANVQVGTPTSLVREFRTLHSRFENDDGGDGIVFYQHRLGMIDHCHFELDDPASAGTASIRLKQVAGVGETEGVYVDHSKFSTSAATSWSISVEDNDAVLFVANSRFGPNASAPAIINNPQAAFVKLENNYKTLSINWTNSDSEVVREGNYRFGDQGPQDGYWPWRLCGLFSAGVGNTGTAETDLTTCFIPAATLANGTAGHIHVTAFGTYNDNTNSKRARVYFDGEAIFVFPVSNDAVGSNDFWRVDCMIGRRDNTNAQYHCQGEVDDDQSAVATLARSSTQSGHVMTGANGWRSTAIVKVTGQGDATDDVLLKGFKVMVVP